MINVQTKDGVRICEVRDGSLWTLGHSVTRCRMLQPACEAALLFVPYVTYGQLESIVRGIAASRYARTSEESLPHVLASFLMTDKQRIAARGLSTGPGNAWDFGSTTVNRLRAYGFVTGSTILTLTDVGHFALDPKPMHYMYGQDYPPCGATGQGCPMIHKVTCLKCQLVAEQKQ